MLSETIAIQKLELFLKSLRQGDFADEIDKAFDQFNAFVKNYDNSRLYLRDKYLHELYADGKAGQRQIVFIANKALENTVPSLARTIAESIVSLYVQNEDDEFLGLLLSIILKYDFTEFISIESTGQNLRLESNGVNFLPRIDAINHDIRLNLLRLALKKYSRLVVAEKLPNSQELPSVIQRLNHVILLLIEFDKMELKRRTSLQPFALPNNEIAYSPEIAIDLFEIELDALAYDENLFATYKIPLFPVLEADKLDFTGNKIVFTNEGKGCLPPVVIRVQAIDDEFELGESKTIIQANGVGEMFIEEGSAFASFLRNRSLNIELKVIFSFRKFGHSYDFGVPTRSAGHWLEKVPQVISDTALPYEIPLNGLSFKDFERLCYWIVAEDPKARFENVIWLNEDGGGERGRDVIATEVSTKRRFVFQCKRVEKFNPSDVEDELTTFSKYVFEDPSIKPDVYVLFLSCAINDQSKSKADKLAQQIGMDIDYWPKSTIDRLVRTNSSIIKRFWAVVQRK